MTLAKFVQQSWHVLEPQTELVWGWHMQAIADHVQAVLDGWMSKDPTAKRKLIITVPPGCSKSRIVSVCAPAWMWTKVPTWHPICLSKNPSVALRDALYSRRILESDWYQKRFNPSWKLSQDQNAKGNYSNTAGGSRQSRGWGAGITGDRGDALIIDDPLDVKDRFSKIARAAVNDDWDSAISNRLNDQRTGVRIIIQQRLHEDDLVGHVLTREAGQWEHLNLPQEYEPQRHCKMWTGWSDPRHEEGELLDPVRFPSEVIVEEKNRLGAAGYAAQHQQRPAPAEGAIFQRQWFARRWRELPAYLARRIESWDPSVKDVDGSSYVVGQLWGILGAERYLIDQVRGRMTALGTEQAIRDSTVKWTKAYGQINAILIEDKAAGPMLIERLKPELPGVIPIQPHGGKEERAAGVSAMCEAGNVILPDSSIAPWVGDLVEELLTFPFGSNNDQVDALTQLLSWAQTEMAPVLRMIPAERIGGARVNPHVVR